MNWLIRVMYVTCLIMSVDLAIHLPEQHISAASPRLQCPPAAPHGPMTNAPATPLTEYIINDPSILIDLFAAVPNQTQAEALLQDFTIAHTNLTMELREVIARSPISTYGQTTSVCIGGATVPMVEASDPSGWHTYILILSNTLLWFNTSPGVSAAVGLHYVQSIQRYGYAGQRLRLNPQVICVLYCD